MLTLHMQQSGGFFLWNMRCFGVPPLCFLSVNDSSAPESTDILHSNSGLPHRVKILAFYTVVLLFRVQFVCLSPFGLIISCVTSPMLAGGEGASSRLPPCIGAATDRGACHAASQTVKIIFFS